MAESQVQLIPRVLEHLNLKVLDLTGGAPELHPLFRQLVRNARRLGVEVIDRCNLTILNEPGQADLAAFLADQIAMEFIRVMEGLRSSFAESLVSV